VHTEVEDPDLSVLIVATGPRRFECSVRAFALGREWTKPVEWDGLGDTDLVGKALAGLFDRGRTEQQRRLALQTAGRTFWSAAPPEFQDALGDLIDERERSGAAGRATVYVVSEEPQLPWEIMVPSRPRAGQADETRPMPIGVEFAVGRWVRRDGITPPPT